MYHGRIEAWPPYFIGNDHLTSLEIKGVSHRHGLAEGWKWLAMFLDALPATTARRYCLCSSSISQGKNSLQDSPPVFVHACSLLGFLCSQMAGWFCASQEIWVTLSQFKKILDVISRCFLPALKEQGNKMQSEAVDNIQNCLMKKSTSRNRGADGQYLVQQLLSEELVL